MKQFLEKPARWSRQLIYLMETLLIDTPPSQQDFKVNIIDTINIKI